MQINIIVLDARYCDIHLVKCMLWKLQNIIYSS